MIASAMRRSTSSARPASPIGWNIEPCRRCGRRAGAEGVAAVTKEKGADVLDELVKKGELTIEQGKVLNEELKHNIKDAIRENVTIVTPPDDVISAVDSLSDEQLEALKAHIAAREAAKNAASDEPNEN